ncbi:MAG: hypothetical protein ABSE89_07150 [Sedimentisphaerales bacterium]
MSLTKEQLAIIDDLFESGGDETAVLQKHNISRTVLQDWLKDKDFSDCVADRLKLSKLHSEILLSKYASFAATKLIQLCQSENQETSRKACLDILNLQNDRLLKTDAGQLVESLPSLDPATASKILAALAQENQSAAETGS